MRAAKALLVASTCLLLAGCNDYLDHNERISPYSGEAIAANRVAQMVDPWPASSGSAKFGTNGERMQKAINNYKGGAAASTSSSTAPSAGSGSGNGEQSGNSTSGSSPQN